MEVLLAILVLLIKLVVDFLLIQFLLGSAYVSAIELEMLFTSFLLKEFMHLGCRSAIHSETAELQESRSKWSMGIASADWSTSGASNTKSSDSNYGGFYSAPSAPSLWSVNAA